MWKIAVRLVVLFLLFGCGGGGGGGGTQHSGSAVITVNWPSRSRLIPVAANSIRVFFKQGQQTLADRLIPRPSAGGQSVTTVDGIAAGAVIVDATAYPTVDGSGVAQAHGQTQATIVAGGSVSIGLVMDSTINQIVIAGPSSVTLTQGESSTLSMTAKDASGAVVLTNPKTIVWSSARASYVTVNSSGTITGVTATGSSPGPVSVSVSETESGKSDTVSVTVLVNVGVTVTPSTLDCWIGSARAFTAAVSGTTDQRVTWSVAEGAAGGTISSSGIYVAPNTTGTYHVVATSQANPSKKGVATVNVTTPPPPP